MWPGGYAAVVKQNSKTFLMQGGTSHTNPFRMELFAVFKAVYFIHQQWKSGTLLEDCFIQVFSDCSGVVENVTKMVKEGPRSLNRLKKQDQIIFQQLDKLLVDIDLPFSIVHVTRNSNPYLKLVDKLAKFEANIRLELQEDSDEFNHITPTSVLWRRLR
jgi:ribonuclease HI